MSRAAKATLFASLFVSTLTIWAVHYQQEQEHEVIPLVLSSWSSHEFILTYERHPDYV